MIRTDKALIRTDIFSSWDAHIYIRCKSTFAVSTSRTVERWPVERESIGLRVKHYLAFAISSESKQLIISVLSLLN